MVPEVRIHQTAALTEHCEAEYGEPWRAAEHVVGLFEYSWERADQATFEMDWTVGREPVPAPTELVQTEVAVDPGSDAASCASATTYDDLLDWWSEHGQCADEVVLAADSNVLLTADETSPPNGTAEIGSAPFATANTGPGCAAAPDPEPYRRTPLQYGPAEEFEPVGVAIHEAGHNLLGLALDHHARGRVRARSYPLNPTTVYTVSPMSASSVLWDQMVAEDGANACGTVNEELLDRIEAKDLVYSPCTVSAIAEHTGTATASADEAQWDESVGRETALVHSVEAPTGLAAGGSPADEDAAAAPADSSGSRATEASPGTATDGSGAGGATGAGGAEGERPRRPDVTVRADEASEPVTLSIRPGDDGQGPARTLELGAGADAAAPSEVTNGGTGTATVRTLDLEPGRYEVEARHGTAVDSTQVVVGPDGIAADVSVRVRVRQDSTPRATTVVACGR